VHKPINLNFLAIILKRNPDSAMQGFKGLIGAYNVPGATSFGYLNVVVAMLKVTLLNLEIA
jgi:hypothetical protein